MVKFNKNRFVGSRNKPYLDPFLQVGALTLHVSKNSSSYH